MGNLVVHKTMHCTLASGLSSIQIWDARLMTSLSKHWVSRQVFLLHCVAKTDGNRAHASSEGPSAKSKFLLAKMCFHRLSPPPHPHTPPHPPHPRLSSPTIPSLSISSLLLLLIYLLYFHSNPTSFEQIMITRVMVWLWDLLGYHPPPF